MIVPSSPEIAARLRSERNQGRAQDMGWLSHERVGFNYRLTELQAAIGVAQLERADELLADARPCGRACTAERLESMGAERGGRWRPRGPGPAVSRPGLMSGAAGSSTRPAPRQGRGPRRVGRGAGRAGNRGEGLHAVHPLLPDYRRAVRLGRGTVPGRRTGLARACWRFRSSARWASSRWSGSAPRWPERSACPPPEAHQAAGQIRPVSIIQRTVLPDALLPGPVNSTPSSARARELSARACQRRKVSWPEPSSGGRRMTRETRLAGRGEPTGERHGHGRAAPSPARLRRPRPRGAPAWSRSRRRGCSARRARRVRMRRADPPPRRRQWTSVIPPGGTPGRRRRTASRKARSSPVPCQGPGP